MYVHALSMVEIGRVVQGDAAALPCRVRVLSARADHNHATVAAPT
jgi:hypothetical protein